MRRLSQCHKASLKIAINQESDTRLKHTAHFGTLAFVNVGPGREAEEDEASREAAELRSRFIAILDQRLRREIPVRLERFMRNRGLNANKLANRSHLPYNVVNGAAKGETVPKLASALALAASMGITVEQLIGETIGEDLVARAWFEASQHS